MASDPIRPPADRIDGGAARYRDWYTGTARLRAESVLTLDGDLGEGTFAVLDPAFPRSFDSNKVVLPTLAGRSLDPAAVMAVADDVLGAEGLTHRYIAVYDAAPAEWVASFPDGSWRQEHLVGMACDLSDAGPAAGAAAVPGVAVVEVDEGRAAEFVTVTWREDAPDFNDETVRQLVRRRVRLDRAGVVHRLAVEAPAGEDAPGGLAAQCDLVVRGRTAELDAVSTLLAYRGRGYGDALVAEARRLAREAGVDVIVLEALRDDWPRHWYARRGFTDVSPSLTLTRPPGV